MEKVIIDIGSGSNPKGDANILVEKYPHSDVERGEPCKFDERPMIAADIEFLPFRDKVADFIYATHVLEHVEHPDIACTELIRVGKAGYIETPHPIAEQGCNYPSERRGWRYHKWYVWNDRGKLYFKHKDVDDYCQCRFGVFVRDLIENSLFHGGFDEYVHPILESLGEKRHTGLKWEGSFPFEVIT